MLGGFTAFRWGTKVLGAGVGLDPKSDSPQSSSSSAITAGSPAGGGDGAGLEEAGAGESKTQSISSCFRGGVKVDVVARESKPLQADD